MANRTEEEEEVTLQSPNNPVNVSYDEDQLHPSSDHDDEEIQEQRQRRKKDKKKKKRKVKIMNASGQTDADRRLLRQKQRDLHNDIAFDGPVANNSNNNSNNDNDTSDEEEEGGRKSSRLAGWRRENNKLWDDVRFTREAVLDSENMDLISSKAAREVEKIIQVPRYDATTLAQNLVKKGSIRIGNTSHFNWAGLGFQVGVCFSSLPSNCTFLYGPLDAEFKPKERKKAERRKKSTEEEELEQLEETEPDSMDQKKKSKGDGNELSAVETHIKIIGATLKKRNIEKKQEAEELLDEFQTRLTQEEGITDDRKLAKAGKRFIREASKVNAANLLFNPKSFTQTVENIFHYSFTVKEGVSSIKVRGVEEAEKYGVEPGPVIISKEEDPIKPLPKQAVIALNMKDWRDMCAAYEVEESDVPHREVGAPARKRARRNE